MANDQITSITRAMRILELFAFGTGEQSLSEIADALKLPISTIHRQISTLIECGYIRQHPRRKTYLIDNRFILMGCSVMNKYELRIVARPILEQLARESLETVHLSQLIEDEIFYVDKIESEQSIVCNSRIGNRMPAHATSTGKLLLSAQPDAVINSYCERLHEMRQMTANTITDPEVLRQTLNEVRRNGYALDLEECEENLQCIAAPIYDIDKQMIAAINIAGPSFRVSKQLDSFILAVQRSAKQISNLLGYTESARFHAETKPQK